MKSCSLFSVVFVVSSGLCAFGQAKDPNAAEVLLRYQRSLLWSQSVSMRIEATFDVDTNHPYKNFFSSKVDFIFRQDHDRAEWIGQRLIFDDKGDVDKLNSRVIKRIGTGELFLDVVNTSPFAAFPRAAVVWRDYKEQQKGVLDSSDFGGPLFGRLHGINHKGIAGLLGESNNFRLHDKQENLNGVSCYVLEATTEYGRVTAWIAPEKGYNALKWVLECSRDDLYDDTPIYARWPELQSATAVFDSVEMEQVNDVNTVVFVPKSSRFTHTVKFTNGTKSGDQSEYTVSDIQLNPDFDALGAFKIDLPNGTRVFVEEFQGIHYVWQNGEVVPGVDAPTFEEIDKMVDELKKEKQADSNSED